MAKDVSWADAISRVLQDADGALHYTEIAEKIASSGLRKKMGANPAASVAAVLSQHVSDPDSNYQRVGRGEYTLRTRLAPDKADRSKEIDSPETEAGALQAFGMFWHRQKTSWAGQPKLLGRQGSAAEKVNFAEQVGVYLLHDRDRVIYVGRAQKESLYSRLKSHTMDRLSGRWDRFSWFGLCGVDSQGKLTTPSTGWDHTVVVDTLEALLIETLEPPLNRKRGDNFAGVEYLQVEDPDIEKKKRRQMIEELMDK